MEKGGPEFHCFERFGIEIEYMIVDREGLGVKPIADRLIKAASGAIRNEITRGAIGWSNELALHLIELKCAEPVATLAGLDTLFLDSIREANHLLEDEEAQLLSSGMHPFMNPHGETRLWPHGYNAIYSTFDRIFSCNRHGWSNLQSTHINCSFSGDDEFGRLHAATRLVLPIIPALAASSPLLENRISGFFDTRMEVYRSNSMRIPIITGDIIPEPVYSREEYEKKILEPIYFELAPFDPEDILREEWVNARGAIARFDRNAIEIRVVDAQETPRADMAVSSAIIGAIKLLADERFSTVESQKAWEVEPLKTILLDTTKSGEQAAIKNSDYCKTLGFEGDGCTAGDLWKHLVTQIDLHDPEFTAPYHEPLDYILTHGTLASRILAAIDHKSSWKAIDGVYRRLAECVATGEML